MRRILLAVVLLMVSGSWMWGAEGTSSSELRNKRMGKNPLILWYPQPASQWVQALPVGNGRLGAMVFGGTAQERLQFNEETLWLGGPHDYAHPGAVKALPEIRRLLFEGKQKEAQDLAMKEFMSQPLHQMPYQPFGDLNLTFPGHEKAEDYYRELDLDEAVATVEYKVDGVTFRREVFSSAVDQALVVRVTADKPGALSFTAALASPHKGVTIAPEGKNGLALTGKLTGEREGVPNALSFAARVVVEADGGEVKATEKGLEFVKVNGATFKLVAATSFKNYQDVSGDPVAKCQTYLEQSKKKSYKALRKDHVADHQKFFRRCALDLGTTEAAQRPTDARVEDFGDSNDPQLVTLYFQYGRYLLLSSSRSGCLPANLQGIWNQDLNPPWDSKWTVNINTEMNYWLAETTNLSECHEALLKMLEDVAASGARTAKEQYGAKGWVLHHNLDLWLGTAPINASDHGIWVSGGAWLSSHFWEHYLFTGDKEYLAKHGYPVMKGAAEFFLDYLVEDPRNDKKWLISGPSNSPEIGGLVMGPTMDHQIIRNLFECCIEASRVLDVDADLRARLEEARKRIAPNQIGKNGQLQEWLEDKDNPNEKHRHISHLWGLYPGHEITPRGTADLVAAAKVTLAQRGDEGTGWSLAWKINFWARLLDGDHAFKMVKDQLRLVGGKKRPGGGGTYPNLFDAHPPFQIDGNFGGSAGIAEMLLQSHTGEIELLPALPQALANGSVQGLRARGGYTVDLTWKDGRLVEARLRADRAGTCRVRSREKVQTLEFKAGEERVVKGE
ncbi:MAG TPA: glycoside hydrolase N-terminal domain-containing protein [Candidatus Sumerlaeota bacterium]|nr:glycoside hydrolase N-terminal domain-containing protein [Candidatus Sumerlaeota bacterium]